MAVELPEPLQWVLLLLAGCRWPEADEDQLREMADHCRKAATELKDATQSSDAAIKRALDGQRGAAAQALTTYWAKYSTGKGTPEDPGYLPGAINALDGMGDMLEQMANSAETAKIQIIAQLGILAFEIATAEAEAPFTAGASLLEVPAMIGVSKAVVSTLLKTLLKEMITMAAKQAAQMAAINLLAQGIELAQGHRKSIDMKEVGQNALGGAVGGASAHLIGKGIGAAGKKLGAEGALNSTAGKMATGAVVGVGADVSTQLITTGKVDPNSLLGSGLSGGAGAGLHAGAAALKGHPDAPKLAEAPHLDSAGAGTRSGPDGPPTFSTSTRSAGDNTYQGPASRSLGSGSGDEGAGNGPGAGADESRVNGLVPFGSPSASASARTPSVDAVSARSLDRSMEGAPDRSLGAVSARSVDRSLGAVSARSVDRSMEGVPDRSASATPEAQLHDVSSVTPETQLRDVASVGRPEQSSVAGEPMTAREQVAQQEPMTAREQVAQREPATLREAAAPQESRGDSPSAQRVEQEPAVPAQEAVATRQEMPTATLQEPMPRQEVGEPALARGGDDLSPAPSATSQHRAAEEPAIRSEVGREELPQQAEPLREPLAEQPGPAGAPLVEHPVEREGAGVSVPMHEQSPVAEVPGEQRAVVAESPAHEQNPVAEVPGEQRAVVPETAPVREQGVVAEVPGEQRAVVTEPVAPVHERQAVVTEPVAPVHEQQAVVAEAPAQQRAAVTEPVAPAHEQRAVVAEAPVEQHTLRAEEVGTESSAVPLQRSGAATVPDLGRVLSGVAHPSGGGDNTSLAGGARVSGAETQPRPGSEQAVPVPGEADPALASGAQNQTAIPPVGGGFVPGPVAGGGGGHGSSSRPASPTPSTPKPSEVRNTRPDSPAGTLRPGPVRSRTDRSASPTRQERPKQDAVPQPERQAAADDRVYEGFREFMDGVDGAGSHLPEYQAEGGLPPAGQEHGQQEPHVEASTHGAPPSSETLGGSKGEGGGEKSAVHLAGQEHGRQEQQESHVEGSTHGAPPSSETLGGSKGEGGGGMSAEHLAGQEHGRQEQQESHVEGSTHGAPPSSEIPGEAGTEKSVEHPAGEGLPPEGEGNVPEPSRRAVTETDFPPAGRRVPVAGDGLCLLHSLAVSSPELVGHGGTGGAGAARRLQSAVEDHFRDLPPEHWPTEVVANYRGNLVARGDLTRSELLDYLPADVRPGYERLPLRDLREIVGEHLTHNAPPPSARERAALLRTARDWERRWLTTEGEMLPAAAAHALGLRLRVLGHDGVPRAVFGPADGRPVTVYHRGNHYDGSEPPPRAPQDPHPPATPAAHQHTNDPAQQKATEKKTTEEKAGAEPTVPKDPAEAESSEQPAKPPAPETPKPEGEGGGGPKPPAGPKRIEGSDLVVGLTEHETAVRDKVLAVLERAVPGDRAAARAFADAHFGPATLRPMVSALSRGETWTAKLEGNGWSGSVKLRGELTESTHLRTEKIEFENGADRTVSTGSQHDVQWQSNIGIQARQTVAGAEPAELAAYHHDRGHGEVNLDLGGMVARSKTSEPADVFKSTMRLELDFGDLRHDHTPVSTGSGGHTETVDLGMTVARPVRAEGDAVGELRTPPQRLRDGRVGGQEIVLDLSPHGGSEGHRPVEGLLDHVDEAARKEFGKDWPALREKVLAEVDFPRLQRDLKSMTAGEPVTVALTDRRGRTIGSVEISARVGDLHQTGTTKETEFNIGTSVQQVRSSAKSRGNAGQLGLANTLRPAPVSMGVGGAGRLGRDRIEISGDSRAAQLTSKSKVPGVRYEGPVHFELSFNGKPDTHPAGTADVRLLVDRADTTPKAAEAGKATETAEAGKATETAKTVETEGTAPPKTQEVAGPPDSVWHGGDDRGGLGETVVVRDVETTAALRAAVDAKGRERFGDDWDAVRGEVLRGFSQPNLAARLTGMTRGEPLEVKVPGKESLVVTATARVESMTFRREDGKAELNTVSETSTFSVDRRLESRTVAATGQFSGTVAKGTPGADLGAVTTGQQRERVGGQGRQADRVYANGKYSAPQVIYGAHLAVDVHFGRPGEKPEGKSEVSAPLHVEVGLDARDTVKTEAPVGEDGAIAFKPPTESAESTEPAAGGRPDGAGREAVELDRPAATHTAPRRMREQQELNASYVVHTLSGADKVRTTVEDAVRSKYGEPSEEVRQRIGATFDRVALKAQLSQLTRGGKITETVSGTTWKAEVTVTARVTDSAYHSTAEKYEFESGTRSSRGQGNVRDRRERLDAGGRFNVRAPFVTVGGGYSHRIDRTYANGVETVGSASNRGKHVEPAVIFDVGAAYDVKVTFKRLGVDDGSHTQQVDTVARVAVPMRDAEPVGGPVERTTTTQPKGFVEGRRLDSSAIVTDIHALPEAGHGKVEGTADGKAEIPPGPRRTLGESVLSQVEAGWKPAASRRTSGPSPTERNPFSSDWAGIHRKLEAELTPDRLQSRLKGMTAGDEIVVRHGRTTVRVGAVLRDRMEHLGDSGTTEFNTGTDVQRSFADTEGTGNSHQGVFGATAAVPVPGAPVSVTAGLTGTGGRGHDHVDVRNTGTGAGSATKAKVPGSAYRGEAELQFTITRRPLVGPSVHQRRTAAIGFETIVETSETRPVPSKPSAEAPKPSAETAGPERPPRTLPAEAPERVSVQVPPERVWDTGLRDTDVLRHLGDVGGVQDLVRLRGPEYFGKKTWEEMQPLVGSVTSHSHLSALFGTATQGSEVAASIPSKRVTLAGGKGVEVGVKIVSLEHGDTDKAVELSPSNNTSSGTTHAELVSKNAGAQGQVGARVTAGITSHNPAITGGTQRLWREGGTHGDSGQVVNNAKYPTPMARYSGHAEVEVTLFDGNRNPVKEKGVVPFTVDIPLSETTAVDLPGDHYLAFTEDHHSGELRSGEGAGLLEDVHQVVSGGGHPFDQATATPAEREQLMGTARVGRAAYGSGFTAGTAAGEAHIQAAHRLVELSGGSSTATSALLGDLLGKPAGTPLKGEEVRQVLDYVERKQAEGPVTLDDLVAGAQDGWPEQDPYQVHREAWTDHGPANELVTAAMATASDAARPLLQSGLPTVGRLHLTVSGEGPDLPLRQEFELSGDPVEQIRSIEQSTYLKPGTRPSEVSVRLASPPGAAQGWDYRLTARPDGSRELTLRHRRGAEGEQPDEQAGAAAAASITAAGRFAAGRSAARVE
ncbi:hypothetical protein CFP65_0848 [Kitasatospora sp. MMS16-BH015]|uniref:WXG100-like domain-containing protein n=1 Tax=Kitasatospora sp. MMS16-BH015 TaxID=2018025 RepID=UPI000CA3E2AC|nr:hypothetical protein [Kitasatospora sp. MMS16-BH015]AUG75776.1 hypothetical protein CFP65_0848 [Kitasatospora sp. MMS16-BH015]